MSGGDLLASEVPYIPAMPLDLTLSDDETAALEGCFAASLTTTAISCRPAFGRCEIAFVELDPSMELLGRERVICGG
jgi:hypothetical protein